MSDGKGEGDLLVADIGGTNARFALARAVDGGFDISPPSVFLTADYPTMEVALRTFLKEAGAPRLSGVAACAAGPLEGEGPSARISMTNCPWNVSVENLGSVTGVAHPRLINDFSALALSLPALREEELHAVGPALTPVPRAPKGVLGAGTGLGASALVFGAHEEIALPGEGGHTDLAAGNAREVEILSRLQARFGHVSVERVLSGPGIVTLYTALAEIEGKPVPSLTPPDITARARTREDALAVEAIELFCGWLGAVAGNLALTLGARGGIYIGGGIVPGWVSRGDGLFNEKIFRLRFEAKGRFSAWLAAVPVFVILRSDAALLGLARIARAEP